MKLIFTFQFLLVFALSLSLFTIGCTPTSDSGASATGDSPTDNPNSGDGSSSPQPEKPKPHITLDSVRSSSGCLSIPSYFASLTSIDPSTPVFAATTSLQTNSKKNIRKDFNRLLAYGTLTLHNEFMNNLTEFRLAQQDGCQTLALSALGGDIEIFKITDSSETMIKAEKENGEFVQYRWLSPESIEIVNQYMAFDVPCTTNNQILVQSKRIIDWSGLSPKTVDSKSPFWIDPQYLEWAAETVGYNVNSLYETVSSDYVGSNSEKVLVVSKVQEMLQMPPRQEILTCVPVDTTPAEPPAPTTPPEDPTQPDPANPEPPAPTPAPWPNPTPEPPVEPNP